MLEARRFIWIFIGWLMFRTCTKIWNFHLFKLKNQVNNWWMDHPKNPFRLYCILFDAPCLRQFHKLHSHNDNNTKNTRQENNLRANCRILLWIYAMGRIWLHSVHVFKLILWMGRNAISEKCGVKQSVKE